MIRANRAGREPGSLRGQTKLDSSPVFICPGTIIASTYEITGPLGRGAMSEVFAARRISDSTPVALKMLRPASRFLREAAERMRREAIAVARVQSQHVARALAVAEDSEHGVAIVFELLVGETLDDRLRRLGRLALDQAHPIVAQILNGLSDAHDVQVVHRDLKPSNVFLQRLPDGADWVKILDFGVSKLQSAQEFEMLTKKWQNLGTFAYMPPEQITMPSTVDHRADLYACGVVIFRMLVGELPHIAPNVGELISLKRSQPARRLNSARPQGVAPFADALEQFVDTMLAMDPEARCQTAREALSQWRAFASSDNPSCSQLPAP
jgi:eukaryotic-like serine/threonine-protein kinase